MDNLREIPVPVISSRAALPVSFLVGLKCSGQLQWTISSARPVPCKWAEMAEGLRLEVLLQFREFKRPLTIIPSEACRTIASELRSMGVEGAMVTVASDDRKVEKGTFLLQKWSTRQVLETCVCVLGMSFSIASA